MTIYAHFLRAENCKSNGGFVNFSFFSAFVSLLCVCHPIYHLSLRAKDNGEKRENSKNGGIKTHWKGGPTAVCMCVYAKWILNFAPLLCSSLPKEANIFIGAAAAAINKEKTKRRIWFSGHVCWKTKLLQMERRRLRACSRGDEFPLFRVQTKFSPFSLYVFSAIMEGIDLRARREGRMDERAIASGQAAILQSSASAVLHFEWQDLPLFRALFWVCPATYMRIKIRSWINT